MEFELIRLRNELSKLKREESLQSMLISDLQGKLADVTTRLDALKTKITSKPTLDNIETERSFAETLGGGDGRRRGSGFIPVMPGSTKKVLKLREFFMGVSKNDSEWEESKYVPPTCWEYVIVLPNPDHPDIEHRPVSQQEAKRIYQLCFRGEEGSSYQQSQRNFATELKAFLSAFQQLEDWEDGKKWSHGGRLVPDNDATYTDSLSPPKDFLTLLRNALMVKLTQHLGLTARQILSSDGSRIFVVMYGSEADYQNEALRSQSLAQLSISMIDLISLEPCDDLLRPLHVTQPPIFVKMAINDFTRETKGTISTEFLSLDVSDDLNYPSEGVNAGQWDTYYSYLTKCTIAIRKLKEIDLPVSYRHLFLEKTLKKMKEKANNDAGLTTKIQDLWDRLRISRPIGPYTNYTQSINPLTSEDTFAPLWRTYRIDEIGHRSQFRKASRLKLLYSLLNRQIVLHQLTKLELLPDHFALHDDWELSGTNRISTIEDYDYLMIIAKFNKLYQEVFGQSKKRVALRQEWGESFFSIDLPLEKIRNYFGEKIGLFFAFKSLLAKFLLVPSIVGLAVFLIQNLGQDQTTYMLAVDSSYCYFLSIWASLYLEYWVRKESMLAVTWGTVDFEDDEDTRPEFRGELRRSSITDEMDEPYYDSSQRRFNVLIGFLISSILILIVIGIVAALTVLRWELTNKVDIMGFDVAGPLISIVNAVQIQAFNILYGRVAKKLTDLENHKAQSEYESSFILKNYIFQFVNSFNSLYYIAFVKSNLEGCIYADSTGLKVKKYGASCIGELRTQLTTLFLVAYIKDVLLILIPYWNFKRKLRRLRDIAVEMKAERWKLAGLHDTRVIRDEIEEQFILNPYMMLGVDGTFQDYMSITIMFGYARNRQPSLPSPSPALYDNLANHSNFVICIAYLTNIFLFKCIRSVVRPQPA